MARKSLLKRAVSSFTAAAIAVVAMPVIPAFAETGASTFSFDGYDVEYSVKNEWTDGKTIEVKITNTGDEPILNWAFKYNAEGKVNDLWNASVYNSDNTSYIIKNNGWNYEIAPAASVLFGYKLTDFSENSPNSFVLCSKRVDKTEGYDVQYNITKEWNDGLQGEIVITNTSKEPLEAWELSFDSAFEINNLWDGRIISAANGHYVIASEMWSNPIDVGGSKTIGFTGSKQADDDAALNNFSLSVIVIDDDGNNSGTGGNTGNDDPKPNPDIDITTDTDSDKIPDAYEEMYGTDPENPDSDDDGLTDYEEIALTGSDPLVYNSIDESLLDSDADYDEDGLSTREELTLGTNPTQADTDNDRINDYDEINVWHTDPLVPDTDNDGIVDGDEIKIGLDPANPETFGYPDIEYKSTQHISENSISLSGINNEDNDIFTYSVDITSNGYVEPYIYARESCYTSVMKNDFMIGTAPELVYLGNYDIDNVKVSFSISDDYIEKVKSPEETKEEFLNRITIFRYYESANALLPVSTSIDENTGSLYTESDAITTYCLMDREAWINMLQSYVTEDELYVPVKFASATTLKFSPMVESEKIKDMIDVIFVLQSAGENENYFNMEKETILNVSSMLFDNCSNVRIAIVDYKKYTTVNSVKYNYSFNEVDAALEEIEYEVLSNTRCERGHVFDALGRYAEYRNTPNRFVMHFPNGSNYNMYINGNHIEDCGEDVNVSEFVPKVLYYTSSSEETRVKNSIKNRNGLWMRYEDISSELLYEHIINHLAEPEVEFKALVPTGWREITLKTSLKPDGERKIDTDTDDDGLSDWKEINSKLLKLNSSGKVEQITIDEFYSEVDEFMLNELKGTYPKIDIIFKKVTCLPLISLPTDPDGDGDGILDKNEYKWNGLDPRYAHISPLKKDTVETLYPQLNLNLEDGTNSTENPVYLNIKDNTIQIIAKVFFKGSYDTLVPQAKSSGMTMKAAFKEGVKYYWDGTNLGNYYDFMDGMTINTDIIISEARDEKDAITVSFTNLCGYIPSYVTCNDFLVAGGLWTTKRVKTVYINPCSSKRHWLEPNRLFFCEYCDKYAEAIKGHGGNALLYFEYNCAHEFGHVLGLWDAYGNDSSNNGYSITENDNADANKKEFRNLNIMRCRAEELTKGHELVPANEIEMVLQAFEYNNWQYYYQGHCVFWDRDIHQTVSAAIKSNILTYEKNLGGGNYSYYYINRDISNEMHQVTAKNSFPTP